MLTLFAGTLARHYLSTELPDRCSEEYARCVSAGDGMLGALDCRVEVYHCRSFGRFTHPDGTVVRVPAAPEP